MPRKKALLIGICYNDASLLSDHESPIIEKLGRPHLDIRMLADLLCSQYGYSPADITILQDDDVLKAPTAANIKEETVKLVSDAETGECFLFAYAGHAFDKVMLPLDWESAGGIFQADLHHLLVQSLPAGCRLMASYSFECNHNEILIYMYGLPVHHRRVHIRRNDGLKIFIRIRLEYKPAHRTEELAACL